MLGRRDEGRGTTATIRDVVEILAIVAAGIWALYVFVYEQRIKPASEPPAILLTGSMQKVGQHNGLVQISYSAMVRNIGHADVYLIGEGFVAVGVTYSVKGAPSREHPLPGLSRYQRDARVTSQSVVYRVAELTRFANTAYNSGFDVAPGVEVPFHGIILVKSGQVDSIVLYGSLAYTKIPLEGGYPTKVATTSNEAIYFASTDRNPNYNSIEVTLDQISLW